MRPLHVAIVLVVLALAPATSVDAGDEQFKVIVHPKNPVASVGRDFLRNAYLRKETLWGKDRTIRPVDLSAKFSVRNEFARVVLKKSAAPCP